MFEWKLTNNSNGDIIILTYDPKGWDEINFVHNRSEKFDGIFFDFSQSLAFGCKGGGKEFVDEAYDAKGSEADISLDITYDCDAAEKTIRSKLNFSSYAIQFRDNQLYTTIDVEKVGITQVIQNRSDTDVDLLSEESIGGIALNPYDFVDLNMHSKVIQSKSSWSTVTHGCCVSVGVGLAELSIFPPFLSIFADIDKTKDQKTQCSVDRVSTPGFLDGSPTIIDTTNSDILLEPSSATLKWNFTGEVLLETFILTIPTSSDDCTGCNPQGSCGDASGDTNCGSNSSINPGQTNITLVLRLWYGESIDCANESGRVIDLVTISSFNQSAASETVALAGSNSGFGIPFNPGDKIWCCWIVNYTSLPADTKFTFTYNVSDLSIEFDTVRLPTTATTLPIHESWSRICEGITDQTLAFKSEFFGRTNSQGISYPNNGYGSFTAITDGLRIRGFTQVITDTDLQDGETKKGIITNLDDMYDTCQAIWGVGLGIETHDGQEVVRVEEKTYFYSDEILLTFNDVPNIEMTFVEGRAYSSVELGFDKWKPELKNGLDEPMTEATWLFPKIKAFDNVLTLKSPYVAAMYAIETTRRKNIIFETTDDTNYDDDIFIIALNRDTSGVDSSEGIPTFIQADVQGEAEQNEDITVDSGLIDPDSAYNLRFNLFSCLSRVMNQFTTGLTKDPIQDINFSYFEGNGSMKIRYDGALNNGIAGEFNGQTVENVQNTTYEDGLHVRKGPIFLPEEYTFTYPVSFPDYIKICNNPRGKIKFASDGINFMEGWISNLEYSIKTGMANFTIIRSGS